MKILWIFLFSMIICGCAEKSEVSKIGGVDGPTSVYVTTGGKEMYEIITPEEAKKIMDGAQDCIILDVRSKEEFNEGHIPGAVLIPYEEIEDKAEVVLQDKHMQILVYCRSGRRSKIAADALVKLGYTHVKDFGGIIDWPFDIVQ